MHLPSPLDTLFEHVFDEPDRALRAALVREHMRSHTEVEDAITVLMDYGAGIDLPGRIAHAESLLEQLAAHPRVKIYGRGELRAFNLLVALGFWHEHEPTWLHRHHIASTHDDVLIEEARKIAARGWAPEPWRKDLTRTLCVTIDDASTRDIDDALSCVPRMDGGWDLGIHIADPSTFVAKGSALDEAARDRATSVYLPTGTLAMFPRALSEHAMSLIQGQIRPAITTMVHVDQDLNVVDVEVYASIIEVSRRMTYEEVDVVLERDPREAIDVALHDLHYLTCEFFLQRQDEGAVSFDIPEAKIMVDLDSTAPQANETMATPEVRVECVDGASPARTLVAEAMVLASAHTARFCARHDIPVIYRAQDAPEEDLFGAEVMAMPEGLPRYFAMRRKMSRSRVTTYPEPHFGLGLQMYVQATSPIRRYSDLICQRQVKAFLVGEALPYSSDEILQVAMDVESAAGEALRASREATRYWTYFYLAQRVGETMEATLLSWRDEHVAFVFLHDIALSVRCGMSRRHEPGARLQVVIERADARRGSLRLKEA